MNPGPVNEVRFRVLVPVWGERYIRDFCAIALPALLADGNLPALTRAAPCEVVFLTTRSSQAFFESAAGIRQIRDICPYSFLFIDDLLPLESYGIILTAAYGRGIASLGALQTSTYFVFLNADFVLSNGILSTVIDRIGKGCNAVLAPSLRCKQEEVVDDLQKQVSHCTGTLDASARELVRLTLDNLHLTARASTVNQQLSHHNAANQFFWRVDDATLIGHFFLLFMLCIRPERPFGTCVGWCDYTFVPELVPSGNYDVIVDSDDGFILEMQARRGEAHHIRAGRLTPRELAPRLSFWTTANHRAYAARTIVLRAGALPANFNAVKAEADRFMAELFGHLKQPPTSHRDHPYWTSGILHFQKKLTPSTMPPELQRLSPPRLDVIRQIFAGSNPLLYRIKNALARTFVDVPAHPHRLHFAYLDQTNFAHRIAMLHETATDTLYVRERPSAIDAYARGRSETVDLACLAQLRSGGRIFDGAIVALTDQNLYRIARTLRIVAAHCTENAPIVICVDGIRSFFIDGLYTLYGDTLEFLSTQLPPGVALEDLTLVRAPSRLRPAYHLIKLEELLRRPSLVTLVAAAFVGLASLTRILLANLGERPEGTSSPGISSSATICLRGPWQTLSRERAEAALSFDEASYNRVNRDVALAGIDAETHFFTYGWKEKRDPSAHFSVSGYLDANPEVAAASVDPLTHFREVGLRQGLNGWQR